MLFSYYSVATETLAAVTQVGGGGRAFIYIKWMQVLVRNFQKNPWGYQDPVLWVWLESYQLKNKTLSLHIFRLNILTGCAKAPVEDFSRLNTLRGNKIMF